MNLGNEDVAEILTLLDATSFNELRLETDRFKLMLRRDGSGEWTQALEVLGAPHVVAHGVEAAVSGGRGDAATAQAAAPAHLVEVHSSLPGTFYRAPQPGAPPFVEVGTLVAETTVVCIIETMKLMNSVRAGMRGTIAEICLADAQFAVAGTVLMRIQPERG